MIVLFFIAISLITFEWIYLKRRKVKIKTYVKVFSTLLMAIVYTGVVITIEAEYMYSPNYYLNKLFIPIQHFLTLKGMRT